MRKKPTYAELERRLKELEAQSATHLRGALRGLKNASDNHMMASAVVVTLTALGGREIVAPFAIHDGLSEATIKSLMDDVIRTMDLSKFII